MLGDQTPELGHHDGLRRRLRLMADGYRRGRHGRMAVAELLDEAEAALERLWEELAAADVRAGQRVRGALASLEDGELR